MNTIRPLGNRVLIRVNDAESKSGAIHIPEPFQQRPNTGIVEARGPEAPDVEVGSVVYYTPTGGTAFTRGGIAFVLLNPGDLLGVRTSSKLDDVIERLGR